MRPNQRVPAPVPTMPLEPLVQFHNYCQAYPSIALRLPAISAWVKTQVTPVDDARDSRAILSPEMLGLTTAEARLAAFLVHGGTLTQYAKRHHLSRHTARNQLQAIFTKLGVNRQADLVRLLIGA